MCSLSLFFLKCAAMVFSPTSVFFTKQLSGGQINEEIMLTAFFFFSLISFSAWSSFLYYCYTSPLLICSFTNKQKTIRVRKALTLLMYTDVMEKTSTHAHVAQHGFSS